jgi:hypothetical protein
LLIGTEDYTTIGKPNVQKAKIYVTLEEKS